MQKRTLEELIDLIDPAWSVMQDWIQTAQNSVEVLSGNPEQGKAVLHHLQVTTHSTLGAIAFETGGLLIDHGWLRFLGSGHERIEGDLHSWNAMDEDAPPGALIVAYDVTGGIFAINSGAFPGKAGNVFYFAPDTLTWEDTEQSYTGLLQWALNGDLTDFYENTRWPDWEDEVAALKGNQGISIYPFVFLDEEMPVADRSRRAVPINELCNLYQDFAQQLENLTPGEPLEFIIPTEPQDQAND